MSLNISQQTEARRLGITVDSLLERLINERASSASPANQNAPELPVWRLA
jgi:hypothetical protein